MNSFFDAIGVDHAQWWALTRALLKRDLRGRTSSMGRAGRAGTTGRRALLQQAMIYSVIGLFLATAVAASKDLFFAGTLLCTYVMFMTGTAAEITPVRSVDRKLVGKGQPGPVTSSSSGRKR